MTITIDRAKLQRLFPRARAEILAGLERALAPGGALANAGVMQTARRLEMFLAKKSIETGGFCVFEENLNYTSVASLYRVPGWRQRLGPNPERFVRKPRELAERVYGGRLGNGPEGSGDGWKYRGRGPSQLTFKNNYRSIGAIVGLDLVGNPDAAADPVHMWRISAQYWRDAGCNGFADRNDWEGLIRHVGGGLTNRREHWAELRRIERELARARGVAPPPANPAPLRRSRTVGGGGTAAGGGAVIVAERVTTAVQEAERGLGQISAGTWIGMVVGALIIIGGFVALWARWDDAGRPVPRWLPAWLTRLVGGRKPPEPAEDTP